jgi:hypothetical protein
MPQTPHVEKHFTASETVRDIVIGMSDGLTVPFALAAGLSGAVEATAIIITAGLAEVAAGATSSRRLYGARKFFSPTTIDRRLSRRCEPACAVGRLLILC